MAKAKITYQEYQKVYNDAQIVKELVNHPGWKLIESHMLTEQVRIQDLLVNNKLRTVEERTNNGDKTLITTAESQIAENAGSYKMIQWLLDDIAMILSRPKSLEQAERDRRIEVNKETIVNSVIIPITLPKGLSQTTKNILNKINELIKEVKNHEI